MMKNFYPWTAADFRATPYGGIKEGAIVACRPHSDVSICMVGREAVEEGRRGRVVSTSPHCDDVVRVLWDGVTEDPFRDNAEPANVRNLILISQPK
jgi:hypothetical protein